MRVTLTALLKMYEDVTFARLCAETPYYRQNPDQTFKAWFLKRANHPDQYQSTTVQNGFISFREGFEAAGGTVDEQA